MDIKETKEVLLAVFATTKEGFKLAKDGVSIGDAFSMAANRELIGLNLAAVQGVGQVDDEMKDLSEDEAKEIAEIVMVGLAEVLKEAGFQPNNKVLRYLQVSPKLIALAKHNYIEGKEIYETINAPAQ